MIACRNLGQPTVNSPIPCLILYYHPYTTSRPKETKDLRAYAYLLTLWIRRSKTTGLRSSIYSTFSPTCRVRLPQHRSSNSTGKQSRQDRQTRTLFPSELAQSHSFQKVGRHSKHGQNSEGQLLGTNYRLISINQSALNQNGVGHSQCGHFEFLLMPSSMSGTSCMTYCPTSASHVYMNKPFEFRC